VWRHFFGDLILLLAILLAIYVGVVLQFFG